LDNAARVTVLVDNALVRSCTLPASCAAGRQITTLEGPTASLEDMT
jgi:aerobic-type carbon monoxide dehydrogenase small subunit (CoxS/CutS family)